LFSLAFAASALCRAWPTRATRWLLANRRYVGVSFALSHLAHLLVILALVGWSVHGIVTEGGLVGVLLGGIGYVFVAAMAVTSFDRTAAWLGPRRWSRLHTAGGYYLWTVFFITTAPRMLRSPLYATLALALLAVLVLRLATRAPRYSQRGAMASG
jgi:methionine sulfoxide reductase heme-binding subunit